MPRIMLCSSRLAAYTACAAALLIVSACQNVPKYKRSSGKFNEWSDYEGKNFSPSHGIVGAVDPAAGTITIIDGKNTRVFAVTPATRIMHEGADITLAQVPIKQEIKYTMTPDRKGLLTIWYGEHINTYHRGVVQKDKNSFY